MQIIERIINPGQELSGNRQLFTNSMLKAMIVPLVIEQVLQLIVGLADTMMVSYAGEAIVAGVGLDTMIYTIFIYLFTAITAGGSSSSWLFTICFPQSYSLLRCRCPRDSVLRVM